MSSTRATTTIRLPLQVLRALKELAGRDGKSLNRLFLEMAERYLKEPPRPGRIPKDDPIWNIGKDPFESGLGDLAENHDEYLYGKHSRFAR